MELNNKVANTVVFLRQKHCLKLNQFYLFWYNDHFLLLLVVTLKVKNIIYGIFYTLYCDDPALGLVLNLDQKKLKSDSFDLFHYNTDEP